jgi:hypothetical protein
VKVSLTINVLVSPWQHELHLDLEGFTSGRSEELRQAAVLQRLVLRRSSPSGAASTSMSSSLAYPELAAPSRVDPRWAFDGTTCIMLSGSGDGPISVQLWLESLKAELEGLFIDKGPDQGRILRQLVEGPLRAKLASKIAETPELQQAVQQREATFDHYAGALISCADPDDALASHYAASHPKRRAGEKPSEAVARLERAFRSAAAYGCQQAEAGRFWALYGLLTQQERSTYTGRPGVLIQLQHPFCETEGATSSRLGALLNDLLSWAKAQSTTAAPTPPWPDKRGPDPESRPATPRRRSGRRGTATAAAAAAAVAAAAYSAPPSSSEDEAPSLASAVVAAAAAAPAAERDNVVYNYTGSRDHDRACEAGPVLQMCPRWTHPSLRLPASSARGTATASLARPAVLCLSTRLTARAGPASPARRPGPPAPASSPLSDPRHPPRDH